MVPSAVKKGIGVKKQKYVHLTALPGQLIEQLRGKKQKEIVAVLAERKAFSADSALQLQDLLEQVGCTNAPVKRPIGSN